MSIHETTFSQREYVVDPLPLLVDGSIAFGFGTAFAIIVAGLRYGAREGGGASRPNVSEDQQQQVPSAPAKPTPRRQSGR